MVMSHMIRLASAGDIAHITELDPGFNAVSLQSASGHHLVAIDSSSRRLLGYGSLTELRADISAYRLHLTVHPTCRRQRVGTLLLKSVLKHVSVSRTWIIEARAQGKDEATLKFLHNAGFVEVDRQHRLLLELDQAETALLKSQTETLRLRGVRVVSLAAETEDEYRFERWRTLEAEDCIYESLADFLAWYRRREIIPEGCFFAKMDDRYVGYTFLSLKNTVDEPGVVEQGYTLVASTHRGQGIASTLKLHAINYAKGNGYASIRTSTLASNTPMLAINKRAGFRTEGSEVFLEMRREVQE